MKSLIPGHRYALAWFEPPTVTTTPSVNGQFPQQELQFIQKEKTGCCGFKTVRNGTTNEEVLAVLIDRLEYLGSKIPSPENTTAIAMLKQALFWLNKRTANRVARGVEGTPKP